jgi:hypothetical protein
VIGEVIYLARAGRDEFVELRNASGAAAPIGGWRLGGGVDFTFPAGATIGINESAIVVGTDPALFRARYAIPQTVRVVGPLRRGFGHRGRGAAELPEQPRVQGLRRDLPGGGRRVAAARPADPGVDHGHGVAARG